jgi:hypothetical protein
MSVVDDYFSKQPQKILSKKLSHHDGFTIAPEG